MIKTTETMEKTNLDIAGYKQCIIDTLAQMRELVNIKDIYRTAVELPTIDPNKKTTIVITGPSGAGKGETLKQLLASTEISRVTTATTRARRLQKDGHEKDEAENAYTWITLTTEQREALQTENPEKIEQVKHDLTEQYKLIECSYHMGNIYGLPESNISNANGDILILETDPNGVQAYIEKTNLSDICNLIIITILPDPEDMSPLEQAINARNDTQKRLTDGPKGIQLMTGYTHYFVINRVATSAEEGAAKTANKISTLLNELIS